MEAEQHEAKQHFELLAKRIGSDPAEVEKILSAIGLDAKTLARLRIASSDDGLTDFQRMIRAIGEVAV